MNEKKKNDGRNRHEFSAFTLSICRNTATRQHLEAGLRLHFGYTDICIHVPVRIIKNKNNTPSIL